jgi:hypothetical protein
MGPGQRAAAMRDAGCELRDACFAMRIVVSSSVHCLVVLSSFRVRKNGPAGPTREAQRIGGDSGPDPAGGRHLLD